VECPGDEVSRRLSSFNGHNKLVYYDVPAAAVGP
jgi:hypothetical protein